MFHSKVMMISNSQLSLISNFIELQLVEEFIFLTSQWQNYKRMSPKPNFLVQLE